MLAAQGQEAAPGQTHLHRWHFPTLQEINGPENSQVLSTVLITASGNDNSHVYWGFRFQENSELSWSKRHVHHADTPPPFSPILPILQPTSFVHSEQVTPWAARTASMVIHDLCLRAGASCSSSSVQPDAYSILGWVGAPLQQAPAWRFLHRIRQGQTKSAAVGAV